MAPPEAPHPVDQYEVVKKHAEGTATASAAQLEAFHRSVEAKLTANVLSREQREELNVNIIRLLRARAPEGAEKEKYVNLEARLSAPTTTPTTAPTGAPAATPPIQWEKYGWPGKMVGQAVAWWNWLSGLLGDSAKSFLAKGGDMLSNLTGINYFRDATAEKPEQPELPPELDFTTLNIPDALAARNRTLLVGAAKTKVEMKERTVSGVKEICLKIGNKTYMLKRKDADGTERPIGATTSSVLSAIEQVRQIPLLASAASASVVREADGLSIQSLLGNVTLDARQLEQITQRVMQAQGAGTKRVDGLTLSCEFTPSATITSVAGFLPKDVQDLVKTGGGQKVVNLVLEEIPE